MEEGRDQGHYLGEWREGVSVVVNNREVEGRKEGRKEG